MAAMRASLAPFFRSSAMAFLNPSIIGLYFMRTMARVFASIVKAVTDLRFMFRLLLKIADGGVAIGQKTKWGNADPFSFLRGASVTAQISAVIFATLRGAGTSASVGALFVVV